MSRHYQRELELRRALRRYDAEPVRTRRAVAQPHPHRRRLLNVLVAFRRHGGRPA